MKKENGIGMVAVAIGIIAIIAIITTIVIVIKGIYKDMNEKNIKANMLLIQGKCKVVQDNSIMKKNQEDYVGTKLSEFKDIDENEKNNKENDNSGEESAEASSEEQQSSEEQNSETNNEENKEDNKEEDKNKNDNKKLGIIEYFKTLELIPAEEFEKYYVLTDDDLQKLNLDFKNEKDAYYLINYETSEVIFTKGLNGIYKLSEMSTDEQEENNKEENTESKSEEQQSGEEQNNDQEPKSE